MKFTGYFTGAKLDLSAYRRRLEQHLDQELQKTAKIWLGAVTGRVPVWSGMARGSLLELAELIDGRILIQPKVASRIMQGRTLGTVQQTDFIITITTTVPHYVEQEYKNVGVSKSAPWLSFQAGAAAYRQAAQSVRLLKPIYTPKYFKVG